MPGDTRAALLNTYGDMMLVRVSALPGPSVRTEQDQLKCLHPVAQHGGTVARWMARPFFSSDPELSWPGLPSTFTWAQEIADFG